MRLLSLDDTEAGVLAIGSMPVGIIAIGGMPVGVVAVGIAAAGGVSASCGAGAGLVMITCGAGVGGYTAGVGLGIGLKSAFVGLGLSVLDTKEVVERSAPAPSRFDQRAQDETVAIERLESGELSEGWVLLHATRERYEPWSLVAGGTPLELTDRKLTRELGKLTEQDTRVLAHLVAEERLDESALTADYRSAQPRKRVFRCDKLVTTGKEPGPPTKETVERLDTFGAVWKGALLLAGLALAGWLVRDRIDDLELDRKAEVTFQARVTRAAGQAPAVGQECTIRSWLRTDGAARRKAAVEVSCGGPVLYERKMDEPAMFDEVAEPGGTSFRYRLKYDDPGSRPDDDDSGSPSLALDTAAGRAVVESWDSPGYRVELQVEPLSEEHTGPALLAGDVAR